MANELSDPVGSLLAQRQPLDKAQAQILYEFIDAQHILKICEREGYTADTKVTKLCQIAKEGTGTAAIAAMKELDAMIERASEHQSLPFLSGGSGMQELPAFPSSPDEIAVTVARATFKKKRPRAAGGPIHPYIEGELVDGEDTQSYQPQPTEGPDGAGTGAGDRGNEREGDRTPGPGDSDAGAADHCYDDAGGGADPYPATDEGRPFGAGYHRPPVQDGPQG